MRQEDMRDARKFTWLQLSAGCISNKAYSYVHVLLYLLYDSLAVAYAARSSIELELV
jgi:hypothetical protein